jgi:hypothetical protein
MLETRFIVQEGQNMARCKKALVALLLTLCFLPSQTWAVPAAHVAYQFAIDKVVAGFNARDPAPFTQAIDAEKILDAAFSGMHLEAEWETSFRKGVKNALNTHVTDQMFQQMPEGGYAKLLRIKMDGDIGKALVRVDLGDNGTGYMDMHLTRADNGEVKIVDWYNYATGQLHSETLRQTVAFISPTPSLLGKVYDIASDRREHATFVKKLIQMRVKGEHEQVVRSFLAQDEALRRSRLLNIVTLQSANMTGDMKLYGKLLKNIVRYFSADESMAYLLMDYYYLEGKYGKVLEIADRMQASFGVEDAALIVIKANVLVEMDKAQESAAQAKHAIEIEPEYEYAYLSLLNAQVEQKKYAQAVNTAEILEKRFSYDLNPQSLAENEFFAGFIESGEYRGWKGGQ